MNYGSKRGRGGYDNSQPIPLGSIKPFTSTGFSNAINEVYANTMQSGTLDPRQEVYRSFFVKADIERLTKELNVVVIGLMSTELHYINKEFLPTEITDDQTYKSKTIEFIASLPTLNPAMGVNRSFERTERTQESRLKRYGTHFIMEGDYEKMPEGKVDVALNLMYIAGQFTKNMALMGMNALAERDREAEAKAMQDLNNKQLYTQYTITTRDEFALPHKSRIGLPALVHEKVRLVARRNDGVKPTIAIFPLDKRNIILYNEQFTSYDKAGPDGPNRLWGSGTEITQIHGVSLREAPDLPDTDESYSQLSNIITIGSFALFSAFVDMDTGVEANKIGWKIEDAYSNEWKMVMLEQVIEGCGRFFDKVDGGWKVNYTHVDDVARKINHMTEDEKQDWFGYDDEGNREFERKTFNSKELLEVFDFLAVRPLEGLHMQNFIVGIPGRETGVSVMSPPNLSVGEDAANQSKLINHTGWAGIHIINRRRIEVVQNAFYNGMLGGRNTRILKEGDIDNLKHNGFRLDDESSPCMYIIPMKKGKFEEGPFLEIKGRSEFDNPDVWDAYPKAKFWSAYFGWQYVTPYFLNNGVQGNKVATACFRCETHYMGTGGQLIIRPGQTHHGRGEGPGAAYVRRRGISMYPTLID